MNDRDADSLVRILFECRWHVMIMQTRKAPYVSSPNEPSRNHSGIPILPSFIKDGPKDGCHQNIAASSGSDL